MQQDGQHSLSLDANLGAFFREVVDETSDVAEQRLDQPLKEYVVGLLEDSATKGETVRAAVNRPLALLLADAYEAEPTKRFERLREVGDGILLTGGLYRRHLKRAGLQDRYVVALGQRAYRAASSVLDLPRGGLLVGGESPWDLLGELASAFSELMKFLRAVSDTIAARSARSAEDLARLCEIWLRERSVHLERLLRAQGIQVAPGVLSPH